MITDALGDSDIIKFLFFFFLNEKQNLKKKEKKKKDKTKFSLECEEWVEMGQYWN